MIAGNLPNRVMEVSDEPQALPLKSKGLVQTSSTGTEKVRLIPVHSICAAVWSVLFRANQRQGIP